MLVAPTFACGAFAVELALKALLLRQTGRAPRSHELEKLFKALPQTAQQAIRDAAAAARPATLVAHPLAFDEELKKLNTAFEEWRYVHEHDEMTVNMSFLHHLTRGCLDVGLRAFGEAP
jgi:hypothetical protein